MAEVMFYHLTETALEGALPGLLRRSRDRGWRALVRAGGAGDPRRLARIDDLLWTHADGDFLPHGVAGGSHDADQPVLLTTATGNPNGAQVLFLIDGARADLDEAGRFSRVVLMFEAANPDGLSAARADWKAVSGAGLKAQYWAQDAGRWVMRAESG
ncbi:MAG: DNA polymerase III subunit chi [Pseudomonadota bacterium]